MLGFAPLASAPLADDGAVVVYELVGNNITTGNPVVGSPAVAQEHDLAANGLTTGSPVIQSSTIVQTHVFAPKAITTGQPVVGEVTAIVATGLTADPIITGQPTVGASSTVNFLNLYPSSMSNQGFRDRFDAGGKRTTALYPIIIGNPIRGNSYQTTEGLLILSGQDHVTGQTFYVGSSRYYKFVCTHDRTNRLPAFAGLTIGVPVY